MAVVTLVLLAVLATLPWGSARRPGRALPRELRRHDRPPAPAREVDLAVLLDLTDAALAAGASVPGALTALGRAVDPEPPTHDPVEVPDRGGHRPARAGRAGARASSGEALAHAGRVLLLGASWAEAWQHAPDRLGPLRDALEPAWVDGAAPGPLLRQAAAAVRAARSRQAQEAAARLGVRLVLPLGACYLPAFVLLGVVPVILGAGWLVVGG